MNTTGWAATVWVFYIYNVLLVSSRADREEAEQTWLLSTRTRKDTTEETRRWSLSTGPMIWIHYVNIFPAHNGFITAVCAPQLSQFKRLRAFNFTLLICNDVWDILFSILKAAWGPFSSMLGQYTLMLSSVSALVVVLHSPRGWRQVSTSGDVLRPRRHPGVSHWVVSQPAGPGTFHHFIYRAQRCVSTL